MKTPTALAVLSILPLTASLAASEPADPFPGLRSHEIPGYLTAVIHYDPQVSELVNKTLSSDDDPFTAVRVLRTRLDRTKDGWYFVDYSEGASADPELIITPEGRDEAAVTLPGLHFYLPGNGALYTSGHVDTMFDEHRKYTVKGAAITETKQPFLAVGLEGKAKKDLTIYATPAQTDAVATIAKGSTMTILLADGADHYLVRTAFGLVGWVMIPADSQEAAVIDGLYYAGD
jgi:hypothetical protein